MEPKTQNGMSKEKQLINQENEENGINGRTHNSKKNGIKNGHSPVVVEQTSLEAECCCICWNTPGNSKVHTILYFCVYKCKLFIIHLK